MRGASIAFLFLTLTLAGCADEAPPEADEFQVQSLDVDADTGGIRGVVVDPSITPVPDVTLLLNTGEVATSDADGTFTFSGLDPGTYFVTAEKFLYNSVQTSAQVVAGVEEPPILTIQIERLVGADPYLEIAQLDGFYDCAFALTFITDSCDFVVRTVGNEVGDPAPRGLQNNVNTQYWPMTDSVSSIVQESFWDTSVTKTFRASIDSTPIDNLCDCSEDRYLVVNGDTGHTYGRIDKESGPWPPSGQDVALRGFLPFQETTEADYALSLEFQIFTTFFHNYAPAEGWNLQERDEYPLPS